MGAYLWDQADVGLNPDSAPCAPLVTNLTSQSLNLFLNEIQIPFTFPGCWRDYIREETWESTYLLLIWTIAVTEKLSKYQVHIP